MYLSRPLGLEVDRLERLAPFVGEVSEELGVFLGSDLVLRTQPKRLHGVEHRHLRAVRQGFLLERVPRAEQSRLDLDRILDEVGVAPHQAAQHPRVTEVLVVRVVRVAGLEVQADARAQGCVRNVLDRVLARSPRSPARPHALAGTPGLDRDLVRDHEARIETDPELPDQFGHLRGVRSIAAARHFEEAPSSRTCDRAQARNQLLAAHADSVVDHVQDSLGRLGLQPDGRPVSVRQELRARQGLEAQLVERVGGVRDQLAQEDLLVRVQRVDHEVQQFLDLGLEGERLLGGHLGSMGKREQDPTRYFAVACV